MFFYSLTAKSPITRTNRQPKNRAENFIETMKRLMLLLSKINSDKKFIQIIGYRDARNGDCNKININHQ